MLGEMIPATAPLAVRSAKAEPDRYRVTAPVLMRMSLTLSLIVAAVAVALPTSVTKADYTSQNLPAWAIGPFTRYQGNPILTPQGTGFEGANVFNPGVVVRNGTFQMLYRAQNAQGISQIGYASSTDGHTFTRDANNPVITNSLTNQVYGIEDPRLYELNGTYYSFYTGYDSHNIYLDEATSPDGIHWTQIGAAITGNKDAAVVTDPNDVPVKIDGHYVMYYGETGQGTFITTSTDMIHWSVGTPVNIGFPASYNPFELCVAVTDYQTISGGPTNSDIVLFAARQYTTGGQGSYALTEVEFSGTDPSQELHQLSDPVMTPTAPYEVTGQSGHTIWMNSIFFYQGQWWMYYGGADHVVALATSPLRPPASGPPPGTAFATSFEIGQPPPDWNNAIDTSPGGGGMANVGGNCCGLTAPETGLREEYTHSGPTALMYSGMAMGQADNHAYTEVFDESANPIPVDKNMSLYYYIFPQSNPNSVGTNGTCVSLDLIFSDGTALRNLGAVDENGHGLTPAQQCGHLTVNQWNAVSSNIGKVAAGKEIVRIDVGYSQPNGSGDYRGYIDDIALSDATSAPTIGPVITSVTPASVAPGDVVTVNGHGFGATEPAYGMYLSDDGQTWGMNGSGLPLTVDSWSDTKITFTVPTSTGNLARVHPGTTATFCIVSSCGMTMGIVNGPTGGDSNQSSRVSNTANLADYYDITEHVGIAPNADLTCSGHVDRLDSTSATVGNMLDADAGAHSLLHPDAGTSLSPGTTYADPTSGVSYIWPNVPTCAYDNIDTGTTSQTILMPPNSGETASTTTVLGFVGLGAAGPTTGNATVTYADGSTSMASLNTGDWCQATPSGETLVATAKRTDGALCHVFQWVDSLTPGKVVTSVTIPTTTAMGSDHLRIFSLALGLTSSGTTKTFPWLLWNSPTDLTYGTALSSTQLDASAGDAQGDIAGTFSYTANPVGKVLNAGANHTLTGTFTPTGANAAKWVSGTSVTTTVTVVQAATSIVYSGPASVKSSAKISLKATLHSGSHSVAGASVHLGFSGGVACRATTNSAGVAACAVKAPSKTGTAKVTMSYLGSANYLAISKNAIVKVTK
jgi:predicted GH43/DUF377 family glycosyl hydrolase